VLGGALWAFIPALLSRYRGVPVVLSTILLNFVALELLRLLVEGPLKTRGAGVTGVPQSDTLRDAYWLPTVVQHQGEYVHLGFVLALVVAAVVWLVQSRTTYGFELRVTGLNPVAAEYAGMPVLRRQFSVLLISGGLAGLAGAIQLMGVEGGHFLNGNPASYGYAGIAVALLGRLHPAGIVAAALFFAMLNRGASNLEIFHTGTKRFPLEFSDIAKGLIVLVVLSATTWLARRRATAREP
jgi:simple sugar transport system permease protein